MPCLYYFIKSNSSDDHVFYIKKTSMKMKMITNT